ncbi:hypothetical protein ACFP9V_10630 [Deinococcus radiopugnans]|uniref:hypothetical protein n=1 Tax=Deinococcus radiopugnans TaxID=57497 RepID=UPI00361ECCA5
MLRPAGVDAVSHLEARPGVKDSSKVAAFVRAARATTPELSTVKREPVDNFRRRETSGKEASKLVQAV